jgi:hypothetical protein
MIMAKHESDSQVMLILNHLKTGAEINPMDALKKYGCYRLGAVIYILKGEGYNIATRLELYTKPSGKRGRYAVYRLEDNEI